MRDDEVLELAGDAQKRILPAVNHRLGAKPVRETRVERCVPIGERLALGVLRMKLERDLTDRLEERESELAAELGHRGHPHERVPRKVLQGG